MGPEVATTPQRRRTQSDSPADSTPEPRRARRREPDLKIIAVPALVRVLAAGALFTGSRIGAVVAAVLLIVATVADLRLRVLAPNAATRAIARVAAIVGNAAVIAAMVAGGAGTSAILLGSFVLAADAAIVTVLASSVCAGWSVRRAGRVLDRVMILRWLPVALVLAFSSVAALQVLAVLTGLAFAGAIGVAAWEASQRDPAPARTLAAWERLLDGGPLLRGVASRLRSTITPRTAAVITAVGIWAVFAGPLLDGTERRVRFLLAAELLVIVALALALRSGLAGRLSWALPVIGIGLELLTIGRLIQTTVPGAEVAAIVLMAVIVIHRAELAASTVLDRAEPPAPLRWAGLGFDGRMLAVTAVVAVFGVDSQPGIWVLTAYLAVVFVAGRMLSGSRPGRAPAETPVRAQAQESAATPPGGDRDESSPAPSTIEEVVDLRDRTSTPLASR